MIKGKMIAAGTMRLDDEEVTGCFIECTVAELRDNRPDIFQEVEIRAVQHATSESTDTTPATVASCVSQSVACNAAQDKKRRKT